MTDRPSSAERAGAAGTGPRRAHPFHMHDAMHAQPSAFARVAARSGAPARLFADRLQACRRLWLVGTGTSYHAAEIGEGLVRAASSGRAGAALEAASAGAPGRGAHPEPRAMRSFDFALYGPDLSAEDAVVVVSHRGTKRFSRDSMARAREAGSPTALITGEEAPNGPPGETGVVGDRADVVFRTVAQERSSAHTVSFTGSVAALAALAAALGEPASSLGSRGEPSRETEPAGVPGAGSSGPAGGGPGFLVEKVPAALQGALELEARVRELAAAHAAHRRIWLAGAGPAAVIAREIALKIKETSYLQAEGMATETMLHGPFQCAESGDLFILIAPSGPGRERTAELSRAVRAIGAPYLVVTEAAEERVGRPIPPDARPAETDRGAERPGPEALEAGADAVLGVPDLPGPLAALACALPLQLLAYHLALVRGTDPDGFRLEDPRFARASREVPL